MQWFIDQPELQDVCLQYLMIKFYHTGQHNLTQSKRHIPERQNQEPGPSRHNNTWPEHVQEGHENQRPGGVQQATLGQPASHESDAERIWPGIDKLMMEHDVDMVPDTIMQDDFEMQEQLSNGPSPEKDGGNVLQEEEPTRSRQVSLLLL